jgi:hypothetical protein
VAGLLAVVGVASAGCGAAGSYGREPAAVEPARDTDPAELAGDQRELEERLGGVLARPEVDCERACELGEAICALSGRICAIARRHPDDRAARDRCLDATDGCERSRARIAERCRCGSP